MAAKVEIKGNEAIVKIGGEARSFPIEYKEGHPCFVQSVQVGVKLGKAGSKVWSSNLGIYKNDRFSKYPDPQMAKLAGISEYVLGACSPLNSINRNFVNVEIVAFWDCVKEEQKSKR